MLDVSWQELLVVGALALIVVGPKDLPGLLRSLGQWVGQLRRVARDFQRAMNDAAREADMANLNELNDLRRDLKSNMDFKAQAAKAQSFLDSPANKSAEDKSSGDRKAASNGSGNTEASAAPLTPVTPAAPEKAEPAPNGAVEPADAVREVPAKAAEK